MKKFLITTRLLDFHNENIERLIHNRKWKELTQKEAISSIYSYIRDEILFGYNADDAISASEVFADGYGQCNTKGILFMALLRAVEIPCRIHGFAINKRLQKGAINGLTYILAPKEIIHSWVEVYYKDKWLNLEGFILDKKYISRLQRMFPESKKNFIGYGVATKNFANPEIDWSENDTYIQKEGIIKDFGVFDTPDELFFSHRQKLSPFKNFFYQNITRHKMNANIKAIRDKI